MAPNPLDRRFDGRRPDWAWAADIAHLSTAEGWLYLACVLDLGSRRIVSWSMSNRLTAGLACSALAMTCWRRRLPKGLLAQSDRGGQYANRAYRKLIDDFGIVQSMSRPAHCRDDAAMESYVTTVKVERVGQFRYDIRDQARLDIVDWIEGW